MPFMVLILVVPIVAFGLLGPAAAFGLRWSRGGRAYARARWAIAAAYYALLLGLWIAGPLKSGAPGSLCLLSCMFVFVAPPTTIYLERWELGPPREQRGFEVLPRSGEPRTQDDRGSTAS